MNAWIILLIAAAVLVAVEIATQQVWTLVLAAGCLAAAVMGACGVPALWTVTGAAVLSIVFYIVMIPVLNRWQNRARRRSGSKGRTGMEALLGRTAIVTHDIEPGRLGRARIDGDYWQVQMPGCNHTVHRGAEVVVTAYDSIILTVEHKQPKN